MKVSRVRMSEESNRGREKGARRGKGRKGSGAEGKRGKKEGSNVTPAGEQLIEK